MQTTSTTTSGRPAPRGRFVALLVAFVLIVGACGGDGGSSGDDQALIDAIATQMNSDGMAPPGADLDCMARATVEGLGGADAMEERFGLTVESVNNGQDASNVELPEGEAVSLAAGFLDCGLLDLMAELVAGEGVGDEQSSCIIDAIDGDAFRDSLAAQFMSDAEGSAFAAEADQRLTESLTDAATNCLAG